MKIPRITFLASLVLPIPHRHFHLKDSLEIYWNPGLLCYLQNTLLVKVTSNVSITSHHKKYASSAGLFYIRFSEKGLLLCLRLHFYGPAGTQQAWNGLQASTLLFVFPFLYIKKQFFLVALCTYMDIDYVPTHIQ